MFDLKKGSVQALVKNQQLLMEVDFSIFRNMSIWVSKVAPLTTEY